MINTILVMLSSSLSSVLYWFGKILDSIGSGSKTLILSTFLIYTSSRLLLRPLIGVGASDFVRRNNNSRSNNKKG